MPYTYYHVILHSVRRSQIYFTQIAFLLFSCVCIHRFHCHWNFSYFPPVSAPTGSTATRTFLIQNFVQLLHVNMYSTKATNFVWYLECFNYPPCTECYLKFYPDLVWSKFSTKGFWSSSKFILNFISHILTTQKFAE